MQGVGCGLPGKARAGRGGPCARPRAAVRRPPVRPVMIMIDDWPLLLGLVCGLLVVGLVLLVKLM